MLWVYESNNRNITLPMQSIAKPVSLLMCGYLQNKTNENFQILKL